MQIYTIHGAAKLFLAGNTSDERFMAIARYFDLTPVAEIQPAGRVQEIVLQDGWCFLPPHQLAA